MSLLALLLLCQLPNPVFREITAESGLAFRHWNGRTGEFLLPEIMGSGVALFDYDNDGDLDLYLVQGARYPGYTQKPPIDPKPAQAGDRLYRNDLVKGSVRFVDVTAAAGIQEDGFGMGVACGDIDNDGLIDLYVTNLDGNRLWHNQGGGKFRDITPSSGTAAAGCATSAAFVDLDGDGLLDLYVAHYVVFPKDKNPRCYAANTKLDYCGPDAYTAQADRLFINRGKGRFEDRSRLLASATPGAGLGVTLIDADADGRLDIYVANDGDANHLWRNKGNGTLEEIALYSGVAFNGEGLPEASMGVTVGDADGDGREDIFLTHLEKEHNTLYLNKGGFFEDASNKSGLALPSLPMTGFGTRFFDLENNGTLDLLVLNGAVRTLPDQAKKGDDFPLKQANQLFQNDGKARFRDISNLAGPSMRALEVSRGAAFGDLNNDGACDVVITNNLGPARAYLNAAAKGAHWLGLRVMAADGKRDAVGALVRLWTSAGATPIVRRVDTSGSYLSASDPRVLFGLGKLTRYHRIEVTWPDGSKRNLPPGPIDRYITVTWSAR